MQYVTIQQHHRQPLHPGQQPVQRVLAPEPARWTADMRHFFTTTQIKDTLREAEALGVNTFIARTDFHVMRMWMEYRDEGGALQWFAQTCPEVGSHEACILRASAYGAKACHLHGGVMDHAFAQGKLDDVQPALDLARQKGMLAGIAAHNHHVIEWAEQHLDLDYYMCCYYNPERRDEHAAHDPNASRDITWKKTAKR